MAIITKKSIISNHSNNNSIFIFIVVVIVVLILGDSVQVVNGDSIYVNDWGFEQYQGSMWNMTSPIDYSIPLDSLYAGVKGATFHYPNLLSTRVVEINQIVQFIYNQNETMHLQFSIMQPYTENGGGPPTHLDYSFKVMLDQSIILFQLNNSCSQQSLYYSTYDIDITPLADNNNHTISIGLYVTNPFINETILYYVDNICIYTQPINLINDNIYVSILNGNDQNNNGSLESPFQSIQKAIDSIESNSNNTIFIESGNYTYDITTPLFTRGKTINLVGLDSPWLFGTVGYGLINLDPVPIFLNYQDASEGGCPPYQSEQPTPAPFTMTGIHSSLSSSNDVKEIGCNLISGSQYSLLQLYDFESHFSGLHGAICVNNGSNVLLYNVTIYGVIGSSPLGSINSVGSTVEIDSCLIPALSQLESYIVTWHRSNILIKSINSQLTSTLVMGVATKVTIQDSFLDFLLSTELVDIDLYESFTLDNITIDGPYSMEVDSLSSFFSDTMVTFNNVKFLDYTKGTSSIRFFNNIYMNNVTLNAVAETKSYIELFQITLVQTARFNNITINSFGDSHISTSMFQLNSVATVEMHRIKIKNSKSTFLEINPNTHVTLLDSSFSGNNLFGVITCSQGNLTIKDCTFSKNNVQIVNSNGCNINITSSTFKDNVNYKLSESTIIQHVNGLVSISNITFEKNIGFHVLTISKSELAQLYRLNLKDNHFGHQLLAQETTLQVDQLNIEGNLEQQYVVTLWNTNSTISNSSILNCVYALSIHHSNITFSNFNLKKISGSLAALELLNSRGTWVDSYFIDFSITLFNSSIWSDRSDITFMNFYMTLLSCSSYPIGHYEASNIVFVTAMFNDCIGSVSGGLYIARNSSALFYDCIFDGNSGKEISVIRAEDSTIQIQKSIIMGNLASSIATISIVNSTFNLNYLELRKNTQSPTINLEGSQGIIANTIFADNSADETVVMISNSKVVLSNISFSSTFSLNDGSYSTILAQRNSMVTILYSLFTGNLGTNMPSIISLSSQLLVNNTLFQDNSNLYGIGGDIYLENSVATLYNNQFISGGSHLGGCIYAKWSNFFFYNNVFDGCQASSGGSLFIDKSNGQVNNCIFKNAQANIGEYSRKIDGNNYINNGGAITIWSDLSNNNDPYNIYNNHNNSIQQTIIFINNTIFLNNYGLSGGAIWTSDSYSTLLITGSSFIANSARGGGGGWFVEEIDDLLAPINTFSNNLALYGDNYATIGKQVSIQLPATIQRDLQFPIITKFIDGYQQVVSYHPSLSFELQINALKSNENISRIAVLYLGESIFYVTLMGNPGDQYIINVTLFDTDKLLTFNNFTYITIQSCSGNQYLLHNVCQICPVGTVGYDGLNCWACPSTTNCQSGVILPNEGYWLNNETFPPIVYECDPTVCLAGKCRPYHTGVLCGQCVDGASKSLYYCVECSITNQALVSGFCVFCVAIGVLMARINLPSRTILLALFVTLQLLAIVGEHTTSLFPLFNFRLDYWMTSCISPNLSNYFIKYYVSLGSMVVVMIIAISIPNIERMRQYLNITYVPTRLGQRFISILMVFYTPITYLSATILPCTSIEGVQYLTFDQQMECYSKLHVITILVAVFILLLVSLGLPLYIIRNRTELRSLFVHLRKSYRYWEVFRMLTSLSLILVNIIVKCFDPVNSLIMATITIIYMGLLLTYHPFTHKWRLRSEMALTLMLLMATLISNSRRFESPKLMSRSIILLSCISMSITCVHVIRKYWKKRKQDNQNSKPVKFRLYSDHY